MEEKGVRLKMSDEVMLDALLSTWLSASPYRQVAELVPRCKGKEMPDSDQRYRAYHLLRELDAATSSIMNQVAYSRIGGPQWDEALIAQRKAFENWTAYASTLVVPAATKDPSTDGAGGLE